MKAWGVEFSRFSENQWRDRRGPSVGNGKGGRDWGKGRGMTVMGKGERRAKQNTEEGE